ncbi:DNA-directed RNA polymerase III subunit RPC3 isoform X1 [Eublepharis macularius]|uniref:DNA-directed RNA polymerase III subunit RPC3 n=1 Tax=Eublepharis macularius TaxID=481883 RepID=A0AA97L3G2_EUBMA|nr:DNA-directed RNA polymerase III subunit RPC3 isoform X1 [Eublepharis macularius]
MTQAEIKLSSLLLCEHFGEIVEKIGTHLIRMGSQPLRMIAHDTGMSLDQVRKALCVLIQHNLVTYQLQKRGLVEYEAQCSRVLRILRYPRYIYTAKTLYSDTGELIVEELLLNGKMTMSAVVKKVADRLTETMEDQLSFSSDGKTMEYSEVSNTFVRLADTHFIQRCPLAPETPEPLEAPPPPAPTLVFNEKDMYTVPRLNLIGKGKRRHSDNDDNSEHKAKRQKPNTDSTEPPADDGIYWQVNIDRFHQHFRDQVIVSAVANRMDQTSSEIVRTMLRMSEVTTSSNAPYTQPLSSNEIFRSLPAGYNISKQVLDQYLTLLADDPLAFVGKSGESGGGMYVINLHKALASLATATLESIVQERFGSRCARIFRLLLRKKHLEQKQIEDFAMIPAKEAKEMMYKMLSSNIVSLQEIPKTPDHAPSRTFYLYAVNMLSSARMLLHRCYKSIANLMERRLHETKENRRLLEKSQRVEAILASMQATGAEEAQLQEIEEMITAPERQQLETLKHNVNKIDASENQVDETIFLLESYINSTMKN